MIICTCFWVEKKIRKKTKLHLYTEFLNFNSCQIFCVEKISKFDRDFQNIFLEYLE